MCYDCCKHFFFGVYSCKWSNDDYYTYAFANQSRCGKFFLFAIFIAFIVTLSWTYCWAVLINDSDEINAYLYDVVSFLYHWYALILGITVVLFFYVVMLCFAGFLQILHLHNLHLFLCHKIVLLVCFVSFILGMIYVALLWPDLVSGVKVSFEMTGPFLQLCSLLVLISFAFYFTKVVWISEKNKKLAFISYVIVFTFVLSIPFWQYSPCIHMDAEANMSKPLLIGHKGAPSLAPENTILSYEHAVSCGVFALESDVRLSRDGVPFLMHDPDLLRTTNVEEIFPERKSQRAENFTWNELKQLNAGDWHLKLDPFFTNKYLSKADKAKISAQKIPSLEEFAKFAAQHNKSVIFDLGRPPSHHPYYSEYVNITVNTLLRSGIPQESVLWLISPYQHVVNKLAPDFRVVASEVVSSSYARNYSVELLNLIYGSTTEEAISLNYSVISYTMDESWTFSRAWCQGVWAVTTNRCSIFKELKAPLWSLSKTQYYAIWCTMDVISLVIVIVIFYFGYKRRRREGTYVMVPLFSNSEST
ncbi:unnamed protein product [Clavelina lepadiformis]|uniref:GP-PDE domain-containing protein n=1 Tax=Clavelina lepadiformis TaxID=159417 RepID=A0ABP0FDF4_CLALP